MAASSSTSFTMPLPKVPMDELFARVRESLAKMEKKEAEEKRRREALEERRWRKRRDKMINNKDKYLRIGQNNIKIAEKYYSVQSNYKKYINCFNSVNN